MIKIRNKKAAFIVNSILPALIYGVFFFFLPVENHQDIGKYLENLQSVDQIVRISQMNFWSPIDLIRYSPAWYGIAYFSTLYADPILIISCFRFIIGFSISFFVFYSFPPTLEGKLSGLSVLIVPIVVNHMNEHLRQGFAASLFLFGIISRSKYIKYTLYAAAALFHPVVVFYYVVFSLSKCISIIKVSSGLKLVIVIVFSAIIVMALKFYLSSSDALYASQYDVNSTKRSMVGLLFWISILIIMMFSEKKWVLNNISSIFFVAIMAILYHLFEQSFRLIQTVLPVIAVAAWRLPNINKGLFFLALFIFSSYAWFLKI